MPPSARVRFFCCCCYWLALALDFLPIVPVAGDCWYNGNIYEEDIEVKTKEPCLNCTCTRGTLICYLRVCPRLPNPPPPGCILLHKYQTCCPELICTDFPFYYKRIESRAEPDDLTEYDPSNMKNVCISNGTIYAPGSAMDSSSLCEYCYCLGGRQRCVKPRCLLPIDGCKPLYDSNDCCPVHYNCSGPQFNNNRIPSSTPKPTRKIPKEGKCFVSDRYYREGGKVIGVGHSICDNCYCIRGLIRCEPISCAPPLLGCSPVVREGECCASSYNCSGAIETEPEPNYGNYTILSKDYAKLRRHQQQEEQHLKPYQPQDQEKSKKGTNVPYYVLAESFQQTNMKNSRGPGTFGTTRQFTGTTLDPNAKNTYRNDISKLNSIKRGGYEEKKAKPSVVGDNELLLHATTNYKYFNSLNHKLVHSTTGKYDSSFNRIQDRYQKHEVSVGNDEDLVAGVLDERNNRRIDNENKTKTHQELNDGSNNGSSSSQSELVNGTVHGDTTGGESGVGYTSVDLTGIDHSDTSGVSAANNQSGSAIKNTTLITNVQNKSPDATRNQTGNTIHEESSTEEHNEEASTMTTGVDTTKEYPTTTFGDLNVDEFTISTLGDAASTILSTFEDVFLNVLNSTNCTDYDDAENATTLSTLNIGDDFSKNVTKQIMESHSNATNSSTGNNGTLIETFPTISSNNNNIVNITKRIDLNNELSERNATINNGKLQRTDEGVKNETSTMNNVDRLDAELMRKDNTSLAMRENATFYGNVHLEGNATLPGNGSLQRNVSLERNGDLEINGALETNKASEKNVTLAEENDEWQKNTTRPHQDSDHSSSSNTSITTNNEEDITIVDLESKVKVATAAIPPEIEAILNRTKNKNDDYDDYDYNEPSLPPSLPNLKIIPFVAADAVESKKDSSQENTVYPLLQSKPSSTIYNTNLFSPPVETEGGFVPRDPPILDPFYDPNYHTTGIDVNSSVTVVSAQDVTNLPNVKNNCLVDDLEVRHGEEVPSEVTCMVCTCYYGNVVCHDVQCPNLRPGCKKKVRSDSECCPELVCDVAEEEAPTVVLDRSEELKDDILTVPERVVVTPDPFKDVIKTEPAPNLQSLIGDLMPHILRPTTSKYDSSKPPLSTITSTAHSSLSIPTTTTTPWKNSATKKYETLDQMLQYLLGEVESGSNGGNTGTIVPNVEEETIRDSLSNNNIDNNSSSSSSSSGSAGLLKLAGCNIYGRMYRVGRIIFELSGPCLECKCTETGVQCKSLKC